MTKDQVLFDKIYVPAFVEKCAEFGVQLSQADLPGAMQIVDRLHRVAAAQTQEKSAQATGLIKAAAADLDVKLGLAVAPARGEFDVSSLLKDPAISAALA
jgi:uncharacterized protein YjgD (DUF1641 family)